MKRNLSTLLALLLLLSLTACGGQDGDLFLPEASNDVISAVLPDPGEAEENLPDASQSPPDASRSNLPEGKSDEDNSVEEDGWYTSKEEVALYLHLYGHLPDNYVTKDEAEQAGWSGGNVERYTGEGTAIGGSYFGNREGLLPKAQGRSYTECDIDTPGESSRGAKRIVFSNDGLIYYTEDHYESFELLYGDP